LAESRVLIVEKSNLWNNSCWYLLLCKYLFCFLSRLDWVPFLSKDLVRNIFLT